MDNYGILLRMQDMQRGLDKAVFEKMDMVGYPNKQQYCSAIIDEIGELNHELKPEWCWWKKSIGKVDQGKALEELIDIWHFALGFANSVMYTPKPSTLDGNYKKIDVIQFTHHVIAGLYMEDCEEMFRHLHALSLGLGYDMDAIYEAYIKKNEINHQRAESDY